MIVPLGWLREYVDLPTDPHRVAEMLAEIGFPVAAVQQRPLITGVVAGRVLELGKHPNADRLSIGRIDVGNGARLTIATAATNVASGQTIAVATIGAQLPALRIEPRKMRGIESQGMMISADELALPAEWFEDGILQLEADTQPGTNVVEFFRLMEAVLDVEITTNRADAMSMIGLARELAAYQGTALRLPPIDYPIEPDPAPPSVQIESSDCRRFVVQRFSDVRVRRAPAWMRVRLALAGQRPIDNVVDVSNYVMLEIGQPLHVYDEAAIPHGVLIARDAREGEKFTALEGAQYELAPRDLVIASEDGAQALAGLRGGQRAQVSPQTTSLLLESANFSGARIRRTSARLALRTEASTRHEKALALALTDLGAARAAHLLAAMGARAHAPRSFGAPIEPADPIAFETGDVRRVLGFDLDPTQMQEYLDRLGFAVTADGTRFMVTPPPWRTDVALDADVLEEIARMAGYSRIESAIPPVRAHEIPSHDYDLETQIAQTLCALGYQEVMNYSLHGSSPLEKLRRAGVEPSSPPAQVLNPLSEDQRFLRYALGPGMLEYFARIDRPVRIFEIGHIFNEGEAAPEEFNTLAFGITVEPSQEPEWRDSAFAAIKGDCEALVAALTGRRDGTITADRRNGLHPGKTAVLMLDGREIANIGAVDPRVAHAFGVRLNAYFASIYLENIPEYVLPRYRVPSKYPSTYRDLALLCDIDVTADAIQSAVRSGIGSLCTHVRVFDEYRGPQVPPNKKSIAVRVTLQRDDETITDEQADAAVQRGLAALSERTGAVLRS